MHTLRALPRRRGLDVTGLAPARLRLPSQAALDREQIRRGGLREFVRRAWHQVDPSLLLWNWHHDELCVHLEAVHRREIRTLVVNVPPGTSKSTIVSVLYPAWVWTEDPGHRWIAGTYDDQLALRDARRHRRLVASDWYQARWPHVALPAAREESTAVGLWYNTRGGMRNSITVRSGATGKHGHTHLVDDPTDTHGAAQASGKELAETIEWWDGTMSTRFCDPANAAAVLVMQRLHEADLAGHVARKPGAVVLCLPMRYERNHPFRYGPRTIAGRDYAGDPRTVDGELLHAARFPDAVVRALELDLGPRGAASQLQQRPQPAGGGVFKEAWFRFWTELPPGGTFAISVDCTFKQTSDGSFVVFQVWYVLGGSFYLVDQVRARMDFATTVDELVAFCGRYPRAFKKLIEAKANGPAVVSALQARVPGLTLVEPEGGKEARANAVQPLVAAGNVYLPHPEQARYRTVDPTDGRVGAPWVRSEFLPEVTTFPSAATDDQTDTMTQALNKLAVPVGERLKRAVDGAAKVR